VLEGGPNRQFGPFRPSEIEGGKIFRGLLGGLGLSGLQERRLVVDRGVPDGLDLCSCPGSLRP